MKEHKRLRRLAAVVAVCAVVGALAGIAGTMAAPSGSSSSTSASASKSKSSAKSTARARALRARGGKLRGLGMRLGVGGPPVHSESVVPNEDGTGFDTIVTDSGNLESIDGSKLTIKEGTDKATYKTVTVDAGSNPTVVRNHDEAKLSDLKAGDNVHVVRGPDSTFVYAESDAFRAQERQERGRWHGRDGRHGRGGPPPGIPG